MPRGDLARPRGRQGKPASALGLANRAPPAHLTQVTLTKFKGTQETLGASARKETDGIQPGTVQTDLS